MYKYPLNDLQTIQLQALLDSIHQDVPQQDHELIVHHAIHSLFSHIKSDNTLDKYFNCVICFAVISSFHAEGKLKKIGTITSDLMKLIYANRTSQMTEIREILKADKTLTFTESVSCFPMFSLKLIIL